MDRVGTRLHHGSGQKWVPTGSPEQSLLSAGPQTELLGDPLEPSPLPPSRASADHTGCESKPTTQGGEVSHCCEPLHTPVPSHPGSLPKAQVSFQHLCYLARPLPTVAVLTASLPSESCV